MVSAEPVFHSWISGSPLRLYIIYKTNNLFLQQQNITAITTCTKEVNISIAHAGKNDCQVYADIFAKMELKKRHI